MTYRIGDWGKDISFIVTTNDAEGISQLQSATLTIRNGKTVTTKECVLLKESNKVSYRLEKGVITEHGFVTFDLELKWVDAEIKIENIITDTVK